MMAPEAQQALKWYCWTCTKDRIIRIVIKTFKQHKQFLLGCTRWFCYGFGAAIMWRILN